MAYRDFKDLATKKKKASEKVLRDKAIDIAKNPKYDGYQRWSDSTVSKCFDKNSASGSGIANNEIKLNLQLAEESHKPIIRNFRKITV